MNQNDLGNTTNQNQIDQNQTIINMQPINPNMEIKPENNSLTLTNTVPDNSNKDAIDNEKLKKVEINYTPPSKLKVFALILLFIILIGFVIFLPEVSEYLSLLMNKEETQEEIKITTGKMTCTLSSHTQNLNKDYEIIFSFTDNKLDSTQISTTTKGDITLDEEILDQLNNQCELLSTSVKSLNGVSVSCDYRNGQLIEKQRFNLREINEEELTATFVEAGVNNPEYQAGQDMDKIESNMSISQYECERKKG